MICICLLWSSEFSDPFYYDWHVKRQSQVFKELQGQLNCRNLSKRIRRKELPLCSTHLRLELKKNLKSIVFIRFYCAAYQQCQILRRKEKPYFSDSFNITELPAYLRHEPNLHQKYNKKYIPNSTAIINHLARRVETNFHLFILSYTKW